MKRLMGKMKKTWTAWRFPALAVLAVALVLVCSTKSAMAYFTTYATAKGAVKVSLGSEKTTVEETFQDWKKTIQIRNNGDAACYVRVKVLAGSLYTLSVSGANWSQGSDGYWYYANPVEPGGMTEDALVAAITVPAEMNLDFDVVVVQECTPVVYDDAGNPTGAANADWSRAVQSAEEANQS